jgi:hypothetical protein
MQAKKPGVEAQKTRLEHCNPSRQVSEAENKGCCFRERSAAIERMRSATMLLIPACGHDVVAEKRRRRSCGRGDNGWWWFH